jgi:hypothetical protein
MLVCHGQKFKKGDVRGIEIHNNRESDNNKNEDIDPERTHLNHDLHDREGKTYTKTINELLKEKCTNTATLKKDAVYMHSFVISSDKEFFDKLTHERQEEFFKVAYDYLKDNLGKENIIAAPIHYDEKTPHMTVNHVPLVDDGRLCCKEKINQYRLLQIQDGLPKALQAAGFDIQRGNAIKDRKNEKVKHKEHQKWKEEQLIEKDRVLTIKEKELNEKEKLVNRSLVEVARISLKENEIQSVVRNVKENTNLLGRPTGEVTLDKADFDKLKLSASAGAIAIDENRRINSDNERFKDNAKSLSQENQSLGQENIQLKEKVKSFDRFMNDRQIQERVKDIQNPHFAAYRDIKKDVPFEKYSTYKEEIAYQMMGRSIDRDRIIEAFRNGGESRDTALTALSGAETRVMQEKAQAQAKIQAEQQQQARVAQIERERLTQERKAKEIKSHIQYRPHIAQLIELKARGFNDATAVKEMKNYKVYDTQIKEAMRYLGRDTGHIDRCLAASKEKAPVSRSAEFMTPAMKDTMKMIGDVDKHLQSRGGGGGGASSSLSHQMGGQGIIERFANQDPKIAALMARTPDDDLYNVDWGALTPDQAIDKQKELASHSFDR